MESHRPPWTLGAAALGLMLCGLTAVDSSLRPTSRFVAPLSFPSAVQLGDSGLAQRFGWPVEASEPEVRVWAQLPRIGPVLAGRLVALAERGVLRSPADLLQVRGIGFKMASQLEAWVRWPEAAAVETPSESHGDKRSEGMD